MNERSASGWGRRARGESRLVEHARAAREGYAHMRANPLATLLGVAVMAVALGLPAMLDALLENQRVLATAWGGEPSLTVFIDPDVAVDAARALGRRLATDGEVAKVDFVDARKAFADFAVASGMISLPDPGDAPLPHVLVVTPRASAWENTGAKGLVERLEALPEVDQVVVDFAWVERLDALGALAVRGVLLLALILGGATVLIVGNTIRVLIEQHKQTIEVQKLVGATDAFVRRPFLYSGALHGFLAGLAAWALVEAALAALAAPVRRLAVAYASDFSLRALSVEHGLVLLACATAFGWCGSWVGIGLSLRRLEPGKHG